MVTLSCIRKEFENIHGKLKLIFLTDMCPTQGRSQAPAGGARGPCAEPRSSRGGTGGPHAGTVGTCPSLWPGRRRASDPQSGSPSAQRKPHAGGGRACLTVNCARSQDARDPLLRLRERFCPWPPYAAPSAGRQGARARASPLSPGVPAKRLQPSHIISLCCHAHTSLPASRSLSCQNTICPRVPQPGARPAPTAPARSQARALAAPTEPLIRFSLQGEAPASSLLCPPAGGSSGLGLGCCDRRTRFIYTGCSVHAAGCSGPARCTSGQGPWSGSGQGSAGRSALPEPPPARPEPVLVTGISARRKGGGRPVEGLSGQWAWQANRVEGRHTGQWGAELGWPGREVVLGRARSFPQRARGPAVHLQGAEAAPVSVCSFPGTDWTGFPWKGHHPSPKGGDPGADLGTLRMDFSTSGTPMGPQPVCSHPRQIVCGCILRGREGALPFLTASQQPCRRPGSLSPLKTPASRSWLPSQKEAHETRAPDPLSQPTPGPGRMGLRRVPRNTRQEAGGRRCALRPTFPSTEWSLQSSLGYHLCSRSIPSPRTGACPSSVSWPCRPMLPDVVLGHPGPSSLMSRCLRLPPAASFLR